MDHHLFEEEPVTKLRKMLIRHCRYCRYYRHLPSEFRRHAEDIVQDVLYCLWRKFQGTPSTSFMRFLDAIAENLACGRLHARLRLEINKFAWKAQKEEFRQKELTVNNTKKDDANNMAKQDDPNNELSERCQLLLGHLPPKQQDLFDLLRRGKTMGEAAAEMGISERTARHWRRGAQKCAASLWPPRGEDHSR